MFGEERKRKFFESSFVQYFLEQSGRTLVYIDEFHVYLRNSKLYNWCPRGNLAIVSINHDAWVMSFIIAISNRGIEGIKASTSTIDSEVYIWLCKDVWRRLTSKAEKIKDPVIIWDNASIHIWKESAEFMLKQGIRWVTITPYKPLSIAALKKILDNITPEIWNRWIKSSRTEIMNKMKIFNNLVLKMNIQLKFLKFQISKYS